jgi:DNA polymerase III sliding clamp (beta) subunit (PCNA family)
MITALKFVQGAVAKKDFVPALTHFRIQNRKVKGFNGSLGICAPINIDLDIAPRAADFVRAINACTEEIALHMADNGKLCVRSGKFKTFVECVDSATYPDFEPTGRLVTLGNDLVPALKKIEPFIAEDASRPWACGILLDKESAFATNNIVFLEHWLGYHFPVRVNIPGSAIRELVRIGESPVSMQMEAERVVFHYKDGQWLSTQVLTQPWPDASALLQKLSMKGHRKPSEELWEAIEAVVPFSDEINRCFFKGDHVSTTADADKSGTSVKVKDAPAAGCFNGKQLLALRPLDLSFGFEQYPQAVSFFGARTRGLISGIRA